MFKKTSSKVLMGILIILVFLLGGIEVKSVLDATNKKPTVRVQTKSIGPYAVNSEQSDYQKEVETKLKTALQGTKAVPIIEAISQYFISDFFTLRDKLSSNDVGGLGFVYPRNQGYFKANAIDAYYLDLPNYVKDYKQENLPLVTSVKMEKPVRVSKTTANLTKEDATKIRYVYDAKVTWTYEANDVVDPARINLVDNITIRFVRDTDGTWWIYELVRQQ